MTKIYQVVGSKIKQKRIEIGLTQEKLAKTSGLHRTYIAGLEKGKRNISSAIRKMKCFIKKQIGWDSDIN